MSSQPTRSEKTFIGRLELSPMSLDDVEEVWEIERLSFNAPWPLSHFYSEVKNPVSYAHTARILYPSGRSVLAGYVIFWIVTQKAHFLNIAVHSLYRRQGVGSRLLKYALKVCKRNRVIEAFLEVRRSNLFAQRLYERFGFKTIGVKKDYYSDNREDAVIMYLDM